MGRIVGGEGRGSAPDSVFFVFLDRNFSVILDVGIVSRRLAVTHVLCPNSVPMTTD